MSDKFERQMEVGSPSRITLIILDDKKIVGYRPKLNEFTGGVISTIIMCQAMYWAKAAGNPFYKFRKPCDHKMYKPGDSWCEELGLTGTEFDTGLKRIGQKISRKEAADPDAMIWYWNDMDRKTYYAVNWEKVNRVVAEAYEVMMDESGQDGRNGRAAEIKDCKTTKFKNPELCISGKLKDVVKESVISINRTTKTQSEPDNTSSSMPTRKQVKAELLDLGIDEDEAKRLLDLWEAFLLHQKVLDIQETYAAGKVGNLLAYAKKVLSQRKLYTPQEKQEIYRKYLARDKAAKEAKAKEDKIVLMESEATARDVLRKELVEKVTHGQLEEFEKYLQSEDKSMVRRIYKENGLNSLVVRAELSEFLINLTQKT